MYVALMAEADTFHMAYLKGKTAFRWSVIVYFLFETVQASILHSCKTVNPSYNILLHPGCRL